MKRRKKTLHLAIHATWGERASTIPEQSNVDRIVLLKPPKAVFHVDQNKTEKKGGNVLMGHNKKEHDTKHFELEILVFARSLKPSAR